MISNEQNRTLVALPINSLLVLNELKRTTKASISELSNSIHVNESKIKITVEKLVESGLIESTGIGKTKYYILSVNLYKKMTIFKDMYVKKK